MSNDVIQNQIKLVGFKAARVNLTCVAKKDSKLKPEFSLSLENLILSDSIGFVKVFKVAVRVHLPHDEVYCEVDYHTVFECEQPVDEKFLSSDFATVSAPAIGFPFVRAFISTLTVQAGLPPILLPSINFIQWNKQHHEGPQSISVSTQ